MAMQRVVVVMVWAMLFSLHVTAKPSIPSLSEPIPILFYEDFEPFSYLDSNEQVAGLYPFLVSKLFEELGHDIVFKIYPWQRAKALGMTGQHILAGVLKTPLREKVMDYSENFYTEKSVVFSNVHDTKIMFRPDDMLSLTFVVAKGWSLGDQVDKMIEKSHIKTHEVINNSQVIQMVNERRFSHGITEKFMGELFIKKGRLRDTKLQPFVLHEGRIYLAFGKKSPHHHLQPQVDRVIRKWKKQGKLDWLVQVYSNRMSPHEIKSNEAVDAHPQLEANGF